MAGDLLPVTPDTPATSVSAGEAPFGRKKPPKPLLLFPCRLQSPSFTAVHRRISSTVTPVVGEASGDVRRAFTGELPPPEPPVPHGHSSSPAVRYSPSPSTAPPPSTPSPDAACTTAGHRPPMADHRPTVFSAVTIFDGRSRSSQSELQSAIGDRRPPPSTVSCTTARHQCTTARHQSTTVRLFQLQHRLPRCSPHPARQPPFAADSVPHTAVRVPVRVRHACSSIPSTLPISKSRTAATGHANIQFPHA